MTAHPTISERGFERKITGMIRNATSFAAFQLLWPFVVVEAIAVMALTLSAVWVSIRQSERESLTRLDAVIRSLQSNSFPLHQRVLVQMKGLSGQRVSDGRPESCLDRFDALLGRFSGSSAIGSHTAGANSGRSRGMALSEFVPVEVSSTRYLVGQIGVRQAGDATRLLVLIPERQMSSIRAQQ